MPKAIYVTVTILFLGLGLGDLTGIHAATPPPPAPPSWKDRMFFGGGIGFGFGDVDFVSVEPLIGIRLDPKLSVGATLLYRYTNDDRFPEEIHFNDYGARAFVQFFPVPNFFGQVEYEYLDYEYVLPNLDTDRTTAGSVFVGGGVFQSIGRGAAFFASTLYNLSYDDNDPTSPYDSPWVVRAGVSVGF
ncbi:MAG TPA: hypothetical protein VFD06_07455 [Candidatus Polarisedimenticolia bacterium]|nr:hypothetical protein [Candidatus Polarisedimenticolia bacterium]